MTEENTFDSKVLLKPEETFFITINPDDKHQYHRVSDRLCLSWKDRYNAFMKYWRNKLTELLALYETDYHLNVECSEPYTDKKHSFPRLHLHGYIRFTTIEAIKQFQLITCLHLMTKANINIKRIGNIEGCDEYCRKQQFLKYGTIHNMPPNEHCYIEWLQLSNMYTPLDGSDELIE